MPLLVPCGWQQHPQTRHKQVRCWLVNGVAMVSPIHITYMNVYSTPSLQPVSSRASWPSCCAVQLHSGCWVQNQRCRGPHCAVPGGMMQQKPCSLNTQPAMAGVWYCNNLQPHAAGCYSTAQPRRSVQECGPVPLCAIPAGAACRRWGSWRRSCWAAECAVGDSAGALWSPSHVPSL